MTEDIYDIEKYHCHKCGWVIWGRKTCVIQAVINHQNKEHGEHI